MIITVSPEANWRKGATNEMILIELHYEYAFEYNYEYEYTYEYEYNYKYEYEFMYNAYEYNFNYITSATNLERDSNSLQWNSVTHTL